MITCPQCNSENVAGSLFCDNCGASLTSASAAPAASVLAPSQTPAPVPAAAPVPTPPPVPAPAASGKMKCGFCGAENDAVSTYCENCGSSLAAAASAPPPIPATPPPMPTPAPATPPPMPPPAAPLASSPAAQADSAAPVAPPAVPVTPAPTPIAPPIASAAAPKMIIPTPAMQPPPAGHPRLVVAASGAYFDLFEYTEVMVGRVDPVSGIFPEVDLTAHGGDEGGVSRKHARLTLAGNQYFVEDLASSNGSWLNTTRLAANTRTAINSGDQLRLGKVVLNFFAL